MTKKAKTKKKQTKPKPGNRYVNLDITYRDLKKQCVIRGMPFEDVVGGDFPKLQTWLINNYDNDINRNLLGDFDDWVDDELRQRGSHDLIHPSLRLGYVGDKGGDDNSIKIKKPPVEKKAKVKRERTKDGIFKGTKKALTFKMQGEGKTLSETIKAVSENFETFSEKSVKIWYKKAAKLHG